MSSTDYYYSDDDATFVSYEDDSVLGLEKDSGYTGLGIAAIVIPAIIILVVLIVIIALLVELANARKAISAGAAGRSTTWDWIESITSTFNEVDSERMLHRMFPGGFSQVVQSIEEAYKLYQGYGSTATAPAAASAPTGKALGLDAKTKKQ